MMTIALLLAAQAAGLTTNPPQWLNE